MQQNAGKRNLSLDLGDPPARRAARADRARRRARRELPARRDGPLGLGADVALARNPRLIYASISGYGQTGPWVHRRAYAPVVEAESGIIASQGDAARGRLRQGPPQPRRRLHRARDGVGDPRRAVPTRAHRPRADDRRVDGRDDAVRQRAPPRRAVGRRGRSGWIRSFRPGDYLVLTVADGESLVVSGHPAERGTFELFLAAMDRLDLADDARFADVGHAARQLRRAVATSSATSRRRCPTRTSSNAVRASTARGRPRPQPAELADTEWACERGDRRRRRSRRAARSGSRTLRGASATRPTSACAAARSTAARTTAPCSPSCSATTSDRLDRSSRRRAVEPPPDLTAHASTYDLAVQLQFPVRR